MHMTKRLAVIFLVFSLVMIGVSVLCVGSYVLLFGPTRMEHAKTEMPDTDFPADETSYVEAYVLVPGYVVMGSAVIGLLAVSCIALAMAKKKGD